MISSLYLIGWLACEKEPFTPAFEVHEDFVALVDSFVVEGKRHGKIIEIDNLILQYDTSLEDGLCGQCNSIADPDRVQKIIGINRRNQCWEHAQELEALIFHELGHCLLRREHVTDTLPNGDPKSLMVPGNLTLFAPCKYVFGTVDCNNLHKRSYYIRELFDPSAPVPSWAK